MGKKRIPIYSWLIVLAVLLALFFFSSQPAAESDNLSKGLTVRVLRFFLRNPSTEQLERANHYIRKLAHFTLYTFLGIGLTGMANAKCPKIWLALLVTIDIGMIIACADEYHQILTGEGRSGNLKDVCIDTGGILFGYFLNRLTGKIFKREG